MARYLIDFRYTPHRPLPPSPAGVRALLDMLLAVPSFYLLAHERNDLAPSIHLDVKFKHLKKLIEKREEALRIGFLVAERDDLVPATLRTGDHSVRVKLRLKGDVVDHLRGDRWSLRVHVRDGASVFGMRRFSLQAPYTRDFQYEPLFFEFLRSHGILAPRYFFANLYVNGTRIGVMAVEEHFSKELLESQDRREGVILKFDESYFWGAKRLLGSRPVDFANWRNTPIAEFRSATVDASPALSEQREVGVGLLRGVMYDQLAPSEVFDADLWGRFIAACEIWDVPHGLHYGNLRMYFNPLTFRIEPVAFDASDTSPRDTGSHLTCQGTHLAMMDHLLADPEIRDAFRTGLRALGRIVDSESFVRDMKESERAQLSLLRAEFPWLLPVDWERMRSRARFLTRLGDRDLERLKPPRWNPPKPRRAADFPTAVFAYLETGGNETRLRLHNALSRPVQVTRLRFEPPEVERETPIRERVSPSPPYDLLWTHWPDPPRGLEVALRPPGPDVTRWGVTGLAKLASEDREYPFSAQRTHPARSSNPVPTATVESALQRHPFLELDDAGVSQLRVRRGVWDVEGWLVLPPGHRLRIEAGTSLRFQAGTGLVARGPLQFDGTSNEPVVLEGHRTPAGDGHWAGLAVLEADEDSAWSHVIVRNTSGVARGAWKLTGGVTFRRADAVLSDVRFEGSRAEDALNVIRSRFELQRVEFRETRSDALDIDYSSGRIVDVALMAIGGDGIDVGGSNVEIDRARASEIADKAISIGEKSVVTARDVVVESSGIGLAGKDASRVFLIRSRLSGIRRMGLAAYVKKSRFEGAHLVAEDVQIETSGRTAVAQTGSTIQLNGEDVRPEALDVAKLYEPVKAPSEAAR